MDAELKLSGRSSLDEELTHQAFALRAAHRWVPSETDLRRGTAVMLSEFQNSHNLSVSTFAESASKSRKQICTGIRARRFLTLRVRGKGMKLPDWQLDEAKLALTQAILQHRIGLDNWTIYFALSSSLESLGGCSPIAAVHQQNIQNVVRVVLNSVGVIEDLR